MAMPVTTHDSSTTATLTVPLVVVEPAQLVRHREPVVVGVPFPRQAIYGNPTWRLHDAFGHAYPTQVRVLSRWDDSSVKWLSVLFLADADPGAEQLFSLQPQTSEPIPQPGCMVSVTRSGKRIVVNSGVRGFVLAKGTLSILNEVYEGSVSGLGERGCRFVCTDARGRRREAIVEKLIVRESGPLRASVQLEGSFGRRSGLHFAGLISFYAGSSQVRFELTVKNPSRARHRGGVWDLGDPSSILLQELAVDISLPEGTERCTSWVSNLAETPRHCAMSFELYQDSSGGENWHSRNHVNRNGDLPLQFRGFRVHADDVTHVGLRSSPAVCAASSERFVACALTEFWQQFPSALESNPKTLRIGILPRQANDLHEIQGGEHNTRVFWLDFGSGAWSPDNLMAVAHEPLRAHCAPPWNAASGAVPYLPHPQWRSRDELCQMLETALEGENSFFAKRETIDEYGWRNFGDMWADHEAAYYDGPRPVISHYNNQYDLLYGCLVQYLLSGDYRWWQLAAPLARHIIDIDVYHTQHDKSAYNGGLFWHTTHYHDAATGSHRSVSRTMLGKAMPASGGGPANEHNYTSGLLLYYYLTGDERACETVIGLADWVIAMDDGNQHLLGLFSSTPTGNASSTAATAYHGPGRGAGNSINALLDGWQATGAGRYLQKAVAIIHRTIHPEDDIEQHRLLCAELRWSYTVYFQALARFIDITVGIAEIASIQAYARQSLLHYARWMINHERFYLDFRDELEYPTETWAAQELRKGNVLLMAAALAGDDAERIAYRQRGETILDRAWHDLLTFPSRTYTRPLALVLQQGYLETSLRHPNRDATCPVTEPAPEASDVSVPEPFVPQKQQLRDAFKSPRRLAVVLVRGLRPQGWINVLQRSWVVERIRRQVT